MLATLGELTGGNIPWRGRRSAGKVAIYGNRHSLSVFLENSRAARGGVRRTRCEGINIFALTISDTVDHAVVRWW